MKDLHGKPADPLIVCAKCGHTRVRFRSCKVCLLLERVLEPDVLQRWS